MADRDVDDDSAAFTEQARWLVDWHNRRSEAMATRAVGLLGFIGVILVLLLDGATGLPRLGACALILLVVTMIALAASAVAALLALKPRDVGMPEPENFVQWWREYSADPQKAEPVNQRITESMIRATDENPKSPVVSASREASNRACCFEVAAWTLLAGLVPLGVLMLIVLVQVEGGA